MRPVLEPIGEDDELSRELIAKRRLYWRTFINLVVFVLFVLLFLIVTVSSVSKQAAFLTDELQAALVPVYHVSSLAHIYAYLSVGFPQVFLPDKTQMPRPVIILDKLKPISTYNSIVGGIRIRQNRVDLALDCEDSLGLFADWSIPCFPAFQGPSTQSQAAFGTIANFTANASTKEYSGRLATYPKSSYTVTLGSASSATFAASVAAMETEQFLDAGTRAVFLEFNVWNMNSGHVAVVQVVWELGHRGEVVAQVHVTPLAPTDMKATGTGTMAETLLFAGRVLVFIFTIYYFLDETSEIVSEGKEYLGEIWNYVSWLSLLLLFSSYVIRFSNISAAQAAQFGNKEVVDSTYFTDLNAIAAKSLIPYHIDAFNAVVVILRCAKYIGFIPYVQILVVTLKSAAFTILAYFAFLMPVLTGITVCFNVAFGQQIAYLASFWDASFFLATSFVGEANIEPLIAEFPRTSVFIVYIATIFSVLFLALLFSILAKALQQATDAIEQPTNLKQRTLILESFAHIKGSFLEAIGFKRKLKRWFPGVYRKWYVLPIEEKRKAELLKAQEEQGEAAHVVTATPKARKVEPPRPSITSSDGGVTRIEAELTGQGAENAKLVQAVEVLAGRALRRMNDLETEMKRSMLEAKNRILELQVATDDTKVELNKLVDQATGSAAASP